jgi:hypothetical protein
MEGIFPIKTLTLPLFSLSAAKPGWENSGLSEGRIQCVVLLAEAVNSKYGDPEGRDGTTQGRPISFNTRKDRRGIYSIV